MTVEVESAACGSQAVNGILQASKQNAGEGWQASTIWQNSLPDAHAIFLHVGAAPAIEVPDELGAAGGRAPLPVYDCVPLPPEPQLLIALHQAHNLK